jgi:hypothetical protein
MTGNPLSCPTGRFQTTQKMGEVEYHNTSCS